jgi:hypothetical protein
MVGHAEGQLHHGGNPAAGPARPPGAAGFGTAGQQRRQLGQLIVGQPSGRAGRWTGSACLRSPLPGPRHPLADRPRADAQRLGNLALGPALLLEVPSLEPAGVFPVVRYGFPIWPSITELWEL